MKNSFVRFVPGVICKKDNEVFFVDFKCNILGKYDLCAETTSILGMLPSEGFNTEMLAGKLLWWKDNLIVVPLAAKNAWIFDLKSEKWNKLCLNNEGIRYKFGNAFISGDKMVLIGFGDSRILSVDLHTYLCETIAETGVDGWGRCIAYKDGKYYVASKCDGVICSIDRLSLEVKMDDALRGPLGYEGIAWNGKQFLLIPNGGGCLVTYDECNTVVNKIDIDTYENCGIVAHNGFAYIASYTKRMAAMVCETDVSYQTNKYGYCKMDWIDSENISLLSQNGNVTIFNVKKDEKLDFYISQQRSMFWAQVKTKYKKEIKNMFDSIVIEGTFGLEDLVEYCDL